MRPGVNLKCPSFDFYDSFDIEMLVKIGDVRTEIYQNVLDYLLRSVALIK